VAVAAALIDGGADTMRSALVTWLKEHGAREE
jgi:hypothetical protein